MVGDGGLKHLGEKRWKKRVMEVISLLKAAVEADYVVLGGGNARLLDKVPPDVRLGGNADAFKGGFRLWDMPSSPTTVTTRKTAPAKVKAKAKKTANKKKATMKKTAK
jgi:polyphosphate glucokinase